MSELRLTASEMWNRVDKKLDDQTKKLDEQNEKLGAAVSAIATVKTELRNAVKAHDAADARQRALEIELAALRSRMDKAAGERAAEDKAKQQQNAKANAGLALSATSIAAWLSAMVAAWAPSNWTPPGGS